MFGDPFTNPKGWKLLKLDYLSDKIVDCPHSTPKWTDKGVICIRTSNLTEGDWNWEDTRYVTEGDYIHRTARSEIESGDIILSREGTVGVAAVVNKGVKLCMGQRLVQVRPNYNLVESLYLLHVLLLQLVPKRLNRLMRGSTSKHINVKDLRSLPIPVPPLKDQNKLSQVIEQQKLFKHKLEKISNEKDLFFNSLLQRAFKGEL